MPRKTPRARASNLGGRGGRGTTNKRIRKRVAESDLRVGIEYLLDTALMKEDTKKRLARRPQKRSRK
jgi:hypothetical protein